MRLTVAGHPGSPDMDLEVPDDTRLGDLRPLLARVTGRPELAGTVARRGGTLAVEDVVLDDDQLTGHVPLLPGAIVHVGVRPPAADRLALHARWHVAVVAGPDAGALVAVDRPVGVGRGGGECPGPSLALADPAVSGRQLWLAPGPRGPVVRDGGSRNGTVLVRRGRATAVRRQVGRGRRLCDGDHLLVGRTTLEVRAALAVDRRPRRGTAPRAPVLRFTAATLVAPAVGALVLAAATGNPMLLGLAAVGPATALMAAAADRTTGFASRWRARRRAAVAPAGSPTAAWPDDVVLPCPADLRTRTLQLLTGAAHGPAATPGAGRALAPDGVAPHSAARELVEPLAGDPASRATIDGARADHRAEVPPSPGGRTPVRAGGALGTGGLRALAPDGHVAVVGPRDAALAVARLLLCEEIGTRLRPGAPRLGLRVLCHPDDSPAWAWCRWLVPSGPQAPPDHDELLVVDGIVSTRLPEAGEGRDGSGSTSLARRAAAGATVLVLERHAARVPPWCTTVVHVADDAETVSVTRASRPPATTILRAVSPAWTERQARLLAAIAHRGAPTGGPLLGVARQDVPDVVAFADLPGIPSPDPAVILAGWARARRAAEGHPLDPGLGAPLGLGEGGVPVRLDLFRDGPHGLVAGTTGAGKSELLQTWVLALALTQSPADLAVLLVDYKGGAGLGACAALPHVVGQVTDLDPASAARALTGLRAELRRREHLLARHGVPDLATLRARAPGIAPPRLLVVVDEFRALVDDLPDFVPGLLRVAAQGRSLGVHLLLATQRPGGAVGADLRANLGVRIALRMTDSTESLDVVDVPDAARIPHRLVGRALLRRGSAPPEPVQVAHAGTPPRSRTVEVRRATDGARPPERRSARCPEASSAPSQPVAPWIGALAPPSPSPSPSPSQAAADVWVAAACAAALQGGLRAPRPPWLPALPAHVTTDALMESSVHGPDRPPVLDDGSLPFGLADLPAHQRRAVVAWRPGGGPLLALGTGGSGRSVLLRTLAAMALDRGWHVHAITTATPLLDVRPGHPGAGTAVTADDPLRAARLLQRLLQPGPPSPGPASPRPTGDIDRVRAGDAGAEERAPRLLLVDGLDTVLTALAAVARGRAADLLLELLRDGRRHGVAVAATGASGVPHSVAALFADRLVLPIGDAVAESMAGVPAALSGGRRGPGRGVWLPGAGAVAGAAGPEPDDGDAGGRAREQPDRAPRPWGGPALCQVAMPGPRPARPHEGVVSSAIRVVPVPTTVTTEALRRAVAAPLPAGASLSARAEPPARIPARAGAAASVGVLRSAGSVPTAGTVTAAGDVPTLGDRHGSPALGVPVGLGGDAGGAVRLSIDRGALVVGPPGSGRSTTLATIAQGLLDDDRLVAVVARDGPLRELGELRSACRTSGCTPGGIDRAVDDVLQAWRGRSAGARPPAPVVVVVDDLDRLDGLAPGALARLAEHAAPGDDDEAPRGSRATASHGPVRSAVTPAAAAEPPWRCAPRLVVVASAQTGAATVTFRGLVATLRALRCGVVLDPGEPGSGEVFGVDLSWATDPTRRHRPGAGAVVHGRDAVPVQVAHGG